MTTFGDMAYHLGGVPLGNGSIPTFYGDVQYYFVDGKYGLSGNSGTKPDEALDTIAGAITLARARVNWSATPWARRDVIVIAPGTYAENLTALAHGVTFVGLGHDVRDAQLGVKIKPSTGSPVVVGGIVNSAFYNIGFETGDGAAGSIAFDGGVVNNCYFGNCFFTGPAETATIGAAFYTNQCVKTTFKNCWFANADIGVKFNYEAAGDSISYLDMDSCIVSGCDTTGVYTSSNLVGPHSILRNCEIFGGGQTMAKGVDDNSAILQLSHCHITATDPVEGCRAANGCYGNGALLNTSGE